MAEHATPALTAYTKEDFREWLRKHHKTGHKVAVILHKRHTRKAAPTHRELIEEAICYGWIDTTIRRIDEDTFIRYFSKRAKNSKWSANTQSYAKSLLKQGRMKEQGLHFYKLGLKKKTHDHGIPKNPRQPKKLKESLAKNKKAERLFAILPPFHKEDALSLVFACEAPGDQGETY